MLTYMGFDTDQLVKATEYWNLCHTEKISWEDVVRSAATLHDTSTCAFEDRPATKVCMFWRVKRIDMPGEVQIYTEPGFWRRGCR